jgi:hypothetical protein
VPLARKGRLAPAFKVNRLALVLADQTLLADDDGAGFCPFSRP